MVYKSDPTVSVAECGLTHQTRYRTEVDSGGVHELAPPQLLR